MKKVVLITGGTSGIGLALAEAFLAQGADVAVCARGEAALSEFLQSHPSAMAIKADVTKEADRTLLLDAVSNRFGRLDILVNNAGTFVERNFNSGSFSMTGLEQEIALNLTAPIRLTGEVLKRWNAPEAIVFVTSGFALVSPTRAPTYGAGKAGLRGFAEGLRGQLKAKGTHVLELIPPTTDTPMNANVAGKKLDPAIVASVTLKALSKRKPVALPGEVRMLPLLLRIAPNAMKKIVAAM